MLLYAFLSSPASVVEMSNPRRSERLVSPTNPLPEPVVYGPPSPPSPSPRSIDTRSHTQRVLDSQELNGTPNQHRGSASRAKFADGQGEDLIKYFRKMYIKDVADDLENARVFMHFDDYLHVVLNVPREWETLTEYSSLVDKVMADPDFQLRMKDYLEMCKVDGDVEARLYSVRADLYNKALSILDVQDPDHKDESLRFMPFDPMRITHGIFDAGVSPGLMARVESLLEYHSYYDVINAMIGVASVPHLEEIKDTGKALFDGRGCPRILKGGKADGIDPKDGPFVVRQQKKTQPPRPRERVNFYLSRPRQDDSVDEDKADGSGTYGTGSKRKRSANSKGPTGSKAPRTTSKPVTPRSTPPVADDDPFQSRKLQDVHVQCGSYALDVNSLTILRSHLIMSLADRERFQMKLYDDAAIIDSSAVNMATVAGQRQFVIMLVGLRRLSPEDRGFRDIVKGADQSHKRWGFLEQQLKKNGTLSKGEMHWRNILWGLKVVTKMHEYKMLDIVYRQAGIVGRLSLVVRAVHIDDESKVVVIKSTRPSPTRVSEFKMVTAAKDTAKKYGGDEHWVLSRLPEFIYSEDVLTKIGSLKDRLQAFLNGSAYVNGQTFPYESRIFRIDIQEQLFNIDTLRDAQDVAQVFLDILQCHKWLFDHPKILHRDISMSNIMYRRVQIGALVIVRGVLNDMDLSSYRCDLDARTATSLHRTGTPPFMAHELLDPGGDVKHLFRHDLESLFCVMLVLVSRHCLPIGPLLPPAPPPQPPARCIIDLPHSVAPFNAWFDGDVSWSTLYSVKEALFSTTKREGAEPYNQVHETFAGFHIWIQQIWTFFRDGFHARSVHLTNSKPVEVPSVPLPATGFIEPRAKPILQTPATFDDETLGDYVTYDSFLNVMYSFNNVALTVSYTTEERNVASR